MKKTVQISLVCMLALLALTPTLLADTAREPLATMITSSGAIDWQLSVAHDGGVVTISGPEGIIHQLRFGANENPSLSLGDIAQGLADGAYSYQMYATPRLDAATREALRRSRETGNSEAVERDLRRAGKLPAEPLVQSGTFSIAGGTIVPSDLVEPSTPKVAQPLPTPKDQVIPDDLIVQGSACIGLDCVNNESFGFDTIRLKENSTRIKYEDTSVGSFPSNDWQLTANDSASGGANKFSIEDITGSKVPFTITAGAPTNSMFVDSSGRLGIGTATPVLNLHINTSNTPALRLEQNSSGGFTAQTWDIAGNEANFFVRDVTGGSRLPFRIRPGAPTSSIDINASGDVGVGTASPAVSLHVSGSDGDTALRVTETSGTTALRTLLDLRNNGDLQFILRNTGSGENWQFLAFNNGFQISEVSTTNVFSFLEGGNMQIPGMYTSTSDRNAKENVETVDPQQVLDKVLKLPIATWNFKTQDATMRHMGPMAQDFYSLFGLGNSDKTIGVTDPGGVALAAIQGLYQSLQDLRQENADLKTRLERLEAEKN